MKAKILLTSMVLPALFAACTNDEIVENNGGSISGRKTFEPVGITLAENAETRFSWNAEEGGWNAFTATDKFSAGLVDATPWEIGNSVMTNFVYSSADGKNFTTPSKMMEGIYFFYSYPGFEQLSLRSEIPFDLNATQTKIDLADPTANVNATQLFVSPLYRIEAENADSKLPLEFRSYWSTVALNIKNISDKSFNIVRIVLKNNNGNFVVKGKLDLTALATSDEDKTAGLIYSYDKETGTYVLPNRVDADEQATKEDLYLADFATPDADGEQSVIMVEVENGEVASGKEATAYLQVPADLYDNLVAEINVEVVEEETKVVKTLEKALAKGYKDEDNKSWTRFRRGFATRAFGADGFSVDNVDLLVAPVSNAKYAANYTDFAKLVAADANTDVEIFNVGSLKVDDQVLTLMGRLTTKNVTFKNPIVVTTESTSTKSLSNIKFADKATIEKGTFSLDSDVAAAELTVAKGAKAIVKKIQTGDIVNNGVVEVAVAINDNEGGSHNSQTVTHADGNSATLLISKTNTVNGNPTNVSTLVVDGMPGSMEINGTKNTPTIVTVNGAFSFDGTLKTNAYASLVTGTAEADKITFGPLSVVENKGTIAAVTDGTVTVNGSLAASGETKLMATVDNYGTITGAKVGKYGKVTMKSADATANGLNAVTASTDAGEVDNTIGGFITNVANLTVYAEYEGDKSGNPVLAPGINKLILKNGTWMNATLPDNVLTLVLDGVTIAGDNEALLEKVTTASIKNSTVNKALTMAGVTKLDLTGSTINAASNFTSNTTLEVKPLVNVTVNANLTLTKASALTIGVAEAENPNKVTSKTTINATVSSAEATAITVNKYATLEVTVNGKIGNGNGAVTNIGTVKNYGTITGAAHTGDGNWSGADSSNS